MDQQRWEQVKSVFEKAQELKPESRALFLTQACGDDAALRSEVEALLDHDRRAGGFLDGNAASEIGVAIASAGHLAFSPTEVLSGRFRIVRLLGRGGMGDVYEAKDLELDRLVALKFLPHDLARHPLALTRLKREARAASALNHPSICAVYDIGEHDGQTFIVMEYLEGTTLRNYLRGQALPLDTLLGLSIELADGLDAAHSKGIIHRDLKPENIFATTRGHAKILDFGLAKLTQEGAGSARPANGAERIADPRDVPTVSVDAARLTRPGAIMGTAAYMSPEQIRGDVLDVRTDLFSFGLVLYEMATGRQAFTGSTTAVIHDAILNRPPTSALHLNPDCPPELERIINKALEKDRDLRYQHASDIRADLKRLKRDTDSKRAVVAGLSRQIENGGVKPPLQDSDSQVIAGLMTRHKKAMMALMASGIVIVAALVYYLFRAASHAPAPPAALEFTRVTGSGDVRQADISPDGKYVAYVRGMAGKQSVWLKQLATDSDVQISTLGEDNCPGLAFSPDGSYVYFVRNEDLYQVPFLGGTPRKMLAGISGPPAFSAGGQRIAFVRITAGETSLVTASPDGSGERVLASYKEPEEIDSGRVAWSTDGKSLAIALYTPQLKLATISADGGKAQPATGVPWYAVADLTWLPGSRHLFVAGSPQVGSGSYATSQLYEVSLEGGEVRQITHGLSSYTKVRASTDGKTLLALQEQILATLQVATPGKESESRTLSAGNQDHDGYEGLAWTPDGKIIYLSVHSGRVDIWEVGADGSNPRRLTDNDAYAGLFMPAVSLRGGFIAFIRGDRSRIGIWRMDMDGGNLKQLTQDSDWSPAVSPDGRWVIFFRAEGGKYVLMKVPSGGGPASQLADYTLVYPSVSPDGKWIACRYVPGRSVATILALLPFGGGQPAKVFPLPVTAHAPIPWTPDGHAISYINNVNGVGNVWEQPVEGGAPRPVTHFTSDRIFRFDWSRDGRLALSRGTDQTDAVLIQNYQ
jgi:serine/threonine protein kinase/Tol biopolymer transport system component